MSRLVGATLSVAIYNSIDDLMRLDEEIDVLRGVDISQEVLVDRHEQFHLSMMIHSAPERAKFVVHSLKITHVLQKLLYDEVGEGLGLLTFHIRC